MNQQLSSFDQISRIAQGHAAFQLLWAGIELNVFSLLSKHHRLHRSDIQKELKLDEQPTNILLQGLTSLGLLAHLEGTYSCTHLATEYLLPDSPFNMIDVLGWQYHIVYPGIVDFTESLKQNKNVGLRHFKGDENNLYARLAHEPKLENVFQKAMSSLSNATNRHLVMQANLNDVHHLVDAGGGAATNAIALCRQYPHLRVTVFDSPSICAIAEKSIQEAQLSDRISTLSGDLFETNFPKTVDCVLLSHMLTIWSPEKNTALLRRIFAALPVGGRVIVFNMMAHDTGDGPISCTLGSVYFMSIATGQGRLYSWQEQEGFLRDAGFVKLNRKRLPLDHGIIEGYK